MAGILNWTERIIDDFKLANPIYNEFDSFRQNVQEQIEEHILDPEAHFSRGEAENLRIKLEEMVNKFELLYEKNKLNEKQLEHLKKEVENLSSTVEKLPKGVWYRAATNRIVSYIGQFFNSKEGREIISSAAKGLLTGSDAGPSSS